MCDTRTDTIISLCRQVVDAEHALDRILKTHHVREDMERVRAVLMRVWEGFQQ